MKTDAKGGASAAPKPPRRRALGFVLLIGAISLFADFTDEGARSVLSPYLALFTE